MKEMREIKNNITVHLCILVVVFLGAVPLTAQQNIIRCTILNMSGDVLRTFPGSRCVFLPDGSVLSGKARTLTFYDSSMTQLWQLPMENHHQINLSLDGKLFLVMTSSLRQRETLKVRYDRLEVMDRTGKRLKYFDFYDHYEDINRRIGKRKAPYVLIGESMREHVPEDVKYEFSHANSFYEIPSNSNENKHAAFKKGNFIVNVNVADSEGILLILDKDLKKILWSMKQPKTKNNLTSLHDVQFLPSGKLLAYTNLSPQSQGDFSSIDEIDPLTGKVTNLYVDSAPKNFFSPYCGGVQKLDSGHLLISDITNEHGRAFEVDKKGKRIWQIDNPQKGTNGKPDIFQQIKREDLEAFLKNNRKL